MTYEHILTRVEGQVGIVQFNRPQGAQRPQPGADGRD